MFIKFTGFERTVIVNKNLITELEGSRGRTILYLVDGRTQIVKGDVEENLEILRGKQ